MAYTKLTPIKSTDHFRKSLAYIQRPEKTTDGQLVDSYECIPQAAENLFALVRSKEVIKKGNNIAWHIYQSFAPEDNITPEQALEIGKELMKRMYPDFQYVIATHIDRQHLHNHILVNAVDFRTFHKLHSNKKTYAKLKAISDDICLGHNLSVIDKDGTIEQRRQLREIALSETEIFLNEADDINDIKNRNNLKDNILSEIKSYIGSNTKLSADIENNIIESFQRFQAQTEKAEIYKNTETVHKDLDEIILSAIENHLTANRKPINSVYRKISTKPLMKPLIFLILSPICRIWAMLSKWANIYLLKTGKCRDLYVQHQFQEIIRKLPLNTVSKTKEKDSLLTVEKFMTISTISARENA